MHSALLHKAQFAVFVHVLRKSADERFVRFQFLVRSAEFRRSTKRAIVQRSAETLKHEPCRLLGDAQSAVNLHAGNAVLAINQHPESSHPLIEAKRRVLKDRSDLQRELLIAATTEPQFPSLNEVVLLGATPGAEHLAIRETQGLGVFKAAVRIGEVNNGFL